LAFRRRGVPHKTARVHHAGNWRYGYADEKAVALNKLARLIDSILNRAKTTSFHCDDGSATLRIPYPGRDNRKDQVFCVLQLSARHGVNHKIAPNGPILEVADEQSTMLSLRNDGSVDTESAPTCLVTEGRADIS
jgi:hypothetical protein